MTTPHYTPSQLRALLSSKEATGSYGTPPAVKRRRTKRNDESRMGKNIRRWWDSICSNYGLPARVLYRVPNDGVLGGDKVTRQIRGAILKDEGLRPGHPDYNFDVARNGFHGLRIELKLPGQKPRADQEEAHRVLLEQGYAVEVCRSTAEAINAITNYLAPH